MIQKKKNNKRLPQGKLSRRQEYNTGVIIVARKNEEKRFDILRHSYTLFSQNEYKDVFLRNIAECAGLNKSQLQNMYPQKSDIIGKLQQDFLTCCYRYVERHIDPALDLHYKLSVNTAFFWEAVDSNRGLSTFFRNITTNYELRTQLIEQVYYWHYDMRFEGDELSRNPNLKKALVFSITGGTELYTQKEKLNMSIREIMSILTGAFMHITNNSEEHIRAVLAYTEQQMSELSTADFIDHCVTILDWFTA